MFAFWSFSEKVPTPDNLSNQRRVNVFCLSEQGLNCEVYEDRKGIQTDGPGIFTQGLLLS